MITVRQNIVTGMYAGAEGEARSAQYASLFYRKPRSRHWYASLGHITGQLPPRYDAYAHTAARSMSSLTRHVIASAPSEWQRAGETPSRNASIRARLYRSSCVGMVMRTNIGNAAEAASLFGQVHLFQRYGDIQPTVTSYTGAMCATFHDIMSTVSGATPRRPEIRERNMRAAPNTARNSLGHAHCHHAFESL